MNPIIVWDIETAARPEAELRAIEPPFSAPSNWKDKDAIEGEIARKRVQWYEQAALSALTGKVLAIGLLQDGNVTVLDGGKTASEADMIDQFWHMWSVITEPKFVGFCTHSFDLPFLCRRSWHLGVTVPLIIRDGRRWCWRSVDIQETWMCGLYKPEERISLADLSAYTKVGFKTGSGKDFSALWVGDRAAAVQYLTTDLQLTASCAKKMGVV